MIVATIVISFSKGSAPDLIAHMVEDGRQYCFISDCDLPAGCSADIEIVKPDGLFVIAHCTVDNNQIIVPIPEQATAVRGMAHYIIKVKQTDDAVIFSASGTIWIDDGLITDDMLESIAQVYGLKFPDDFLTTADLTDYVTIQDLAAALTPYALKSELIDVAANPAGESVADLSKLKIGSNIYKIPDPLHVYSTDEHIVGRWIDGSPIFEKSYTFTIADNNNHTIDETYKYGDIMFVGLHGASVNVTSGYTTEYPGIGTPTVGTRIFLNIYGICVSLENYTSIMGECLGNATIQYVKLNGGR